MKPLTGQVTIDKRDHSNSVEKLDALTARFKETNSAQDYFDLGMAYKESGDRETALKFLQRSADLFQKPPAELFRAIGNLHYQRKENDKAFEYFHKALAIEPGYPEVHFCLGRMLKDMGREEEAITHFKKDLESRPANVVAHIKIADALKMLGHEDESISHYNEAIAISPNDANIYNNRANAYKNIGRFGEAISDYEKALALNPQFTIALRNLLFLKPSEEMVKHIEAIIENNQASDTGLMELNFALGKYYDNCEDYARAFEHYRTANQIRRSQVSYKPAAISKFVDRLINTFDEGLVKKSTKFGHDSSLPVFVLGMPRSGTTLVEQIISSHPGVYGAGELPFLHTIEKKMGENSDGNSRYPESVAAITRAEVKAHAEEYLSKISVYSDQSQHIVDKMPANFSRVGLIKLLFPNARIIQCIRRPEDICTSIYLNYFPKGNEYSFDLVELGKYYLDYERLMSHWHRLYPDGIYPVHYEDVVNDLEGESRRLIKYLGLRWSKKCLDFHKLERSIRTTSNLQVRKPIYANSVNRWMNYEPFLQPLISTLSGRNDSIQDEASLAGRK